MKQFVLLAFVVMTFIGSMPLRAQDLSLYEKREYKANDGFTLPYRILYPQNFTPSKKYPLVLILHGAGERGNDNEAQLVHGSKLFLDPVVRKKYPAVVLFPQCPTGKVWFPRPSLTKLLKTEENQRPVELIAVKEVIDQLIAAGYIDTRRIYVSGLSMGGFGTFGAVSMWPDLFAAAAPICGGADVDAVTRYAQKVPFWVFHGGADDVVPVELSRQAVAALKEAGGKVKYSEYPGVGHGSWVKAFAEPDYLKWMFKQKKKVER